MVDNVKRSIGISVAGQYVELLLHIASVMVLARILTPADIGTYSVAAFLTAVLHIFRDFGVGQYIIQERELTTEKIRCAMGVAIILALAMATIVLASSGMVARFYGNPEIQKILWIMSATFAISPLGSFPGAIFRREMQLKKIFFVRVSSTVCHVGVAISLAMLGFGALSLAWANFAGCLSIGIACTLVRPKALPWLPQFTNIKKILSFGGIASIGNAANAAGSNAPDLFVGKIMDMTSAGYLSRANGLVMLFTRFVSDGILPLILPYFAQLRRQGNDVAEHYLLSVAFITAVAWPFFATMMLLSLPIVRILYGPQWDASVPLVEILCIAAATSSISIFAGQVMVAKGRVLNFTAAQLIVQPFRIAAVFVASRYGLLPVATAIVISEMMGLLIISCYLRKTVNVTPTDLIRACGKSALVTLSCVIVPLAVRLFWNGDLLHPWMPLAIGMLGATLGWVSGILLTKHPLAPHLVSAFESIGLVGPRR